VSRLYVLSRGGQSAFSPFIPDFFPTGGAVKDRRTRGEAARGSSTTYQRSRRLGFKVSYSNHYRRGLIKLIQALEFRSTNEHQPVVQALELIKKYATSTAQLYPRGAAADRLRSGRRRLPPGPSRLSHRSRGPASPARRAGSGQLAVAVPRLRAREI
jgi:hypothetical protein